MRIAHSEAIGPLRVMHSHRPTFCTPVRQMIRQTQQDRAPDPTDEIAVRAIPLQMIQAWNLGRGDRLAAPFTDDADFIAFDGSHLRGARQIEAFHQRLFETGVQDTRLAGHVKFVRFLEPRVAVMHAVGGNTLAWQTSATPSRESMQLFVARKHDDGRWRLDAVLNARKLSLERQALWDGFESLSAGDQQQVAAFIASLKP
jgi:uncharacterized protein (TIGR02246 family)